MTATIEPQRCCEKCFQEDLIICFIKQQKSNGICDFCHSSNVNIAELNMVGEFIRKGILRKYETYRTEEYQNRIAQESTISISDIFENHNVLSDLYDDFNQKNSFIDELIRSSGPSDHDKMRGSTDDLEERSLSVLIDKETDIPVGDNWIFESWSVFKQRVKHFNRFFDLGAEQQARIKTLDLLAKLFHQHAIDLAQGTLLWRCRPSPPLDLSEKWLTMSATQIQDAVGPAPISVAKRNRMSPVGIPILYMGDTPQTCLAESRVRAGDLVCLGRFSIRQKLRILDLSNNDKSVINSIFSENYVANTQTCLEFLHEFIEEISMPITDEAQELDYLPTQVLTEFIRLKKFDGIKWRSSQNPNGYNYALFCGPISSYPPDFDDINKLSPYTEWMHLVEFGIHVVSNVNTENKGNRTFNEEDFPKPVIVRDFPQEMPRFIKIKTF